MALTIFRANRKTEFWSSRTPAHVGPGSYTNSQLPSARETAVKFSVKSERAASSGHNERSFGPNDSFPGPGSYAPDLQQKGSSSRAGSSSFANRQHRMAPNAPGATVYCYPTSYVNPGPGSYNTPQRRLTPKPPPRRHNSVFAQPTPNSIPVPVKKQEVSEGEIGPGFYNPSDSLLKHKPAGSNFSASNYVRKLWEPTNQRGNTFTSRENPGPGHYTAAPGSAPEVQGNASFLSRVKMAHEEFVPEEKRNPGPGAYENHTLGPVPTGKQPGFGSKIERGETWAYDMSLPYTKPERTVVPGVGSYELDEESRHKEETKKKALTFEEPGPQQPGFMSGEPRTCLTVIKPDPKPGPGTYESQPSIRQQNYSLYVESGTVKFLSNQERFIGLFEPKEGPAPGQYQNSKTQEPVPEGHSNFKSRSDRFNHLARDNLSVAVVGSQIRPPVGEYNLM